MVGRDKNKFSSKLSVKYGKSYKVGRKNFFLKGEMKFESKLLLYPFPYLLYELF